MKKKKIILRLLAILAILAILLIICLTVLNNYKTPEEKYTTERVDGIHTQQDIDMIKETVDNYVQDKVVPTGISRLYGKYKGKNELSDLYRGIKRVTDYILIIQENLSGKSELDIKNYYTTNKNEVEKNMGIDNEKDFIEFVKYIEKFDSLQTLTSASIVTDTITSDEEFLMFDLNIYYEPEQEVQLKCYFKNSKDEDNKLCKFLVAK